jgi:hypothetical protein
MNEESEHGAHYYEFTGTEFKHLLTVPLEMGHSDFGGET